MTTGLSWNRLRIAMTVTIQLPGEAKRALEDKAEAAGLSAEEYARQVLVRDLGVPEGPNATESAGEEGGALQAVADMILERVRKLPPEAFEGLPRDGASQHDHYIYGTPKRDDL